MLSLDTYRALGAYLEKCAALLGHVQLQDHHKDALKASRKGPLWMMHGLGSGKTVQALAVAEDRGGPALVVVPASLRESFKEQLEGFVSRDRVPQYHIISYEQMRQDPSIVDKVRPNTLIMDEFHRLRNGGPLMDAATYVRSRSPTFIGLSGTGINNHPTELVRLINLVAGKPVWTLADFKRNHLAEVELPLSPAQRARGMTPPLVEVATNLERFAERAGKYIHRFRGTDAFMKNLPTIKEEVVRVPMSPKQEALYNEILSSNKGLSDKIRANLPPSRAEAKDLSSFLNGVRQVLNAPETLHAGLTHEDNPKLRAASRAIQADFDKNPDHRAVIYSDFLDAGVARVATHLQRAGIDTALFHGGLNDKQKKAVVDGYNKGEVAVLGLSPAGGEGLNLKGTRSVDILNPHWNPARTEQPIGRAARFKSHAHLPEEERHVTVRRYLAVHSPSKTWWGRAATPTSADEWIDSRQQEKQRLANQFINALPSFGEGRGPTVARPRDTRVVEMAKAASAFDDAFIFSD